MRISFQQRTIYGKLEKRAMERESQAREESRIRDMKDIAGEPYMGKGLD